MNFTILIASYLMILLSLIGYGLFFYRISINNISLSLEFSILGAIFFLIVVSYFTHFFTYHGYFHNTLILFLGIIFFFYYFNKEKKLLSKYILYFIIIFGILIFALLTDKTHDDFPYYHFPYTYYLTQDKLIIGTGSFNHGFRTPSSIFYLNSLFYLPLIKYFSFHFGAILILGISNLILIFKLKDDFKKKEYDFIFVLTLLSFLFINIFFYRISEHGTDRSAQILIFILFIELLSLYRNDIFLKSFFSKIFILLGLIISLKVFYVLYLLILIPILFKFKDYNFLKIFKSFFINLYFYLFILIGFFLIAVNIFNSGCVLYPISFTCFNNFEWSLFYEAELMKNWYELWSKAGASPTYRDADPDNYIKGFNWLQNWIEFYFFNKVLDFIAGVIFLLFIIFFVFYTKNKKNTYFNKRVWWIYSLIIILFIEWFYNHPSLRYGGYVLVALIMFIPFSVYVSKFDLNERLKKKVILLMVFSLLIFTGRNIDRIYKESLKYNYNFIMNSQYSLSKNNFRIDIFLDDLKNKYKNCKNKNNCLNHNGISILKKKNYYYLIKNR